MISLVRACTAGSFARLHVRPSCSRPSARSGHSMYRRLVRADRPRAAPLRAASCSVRARAERESRVRVVRATDSARPGLKVAVAHGMVPSHIRIRRTGWHMNEGARHHRLYQTPPAAVVSNPGNTSAAGLNELTRLRRGCWQS